MRNLVRSPPAERVGSDQAAAVPEHRGQGREGGERGHAHERRGDDARDRARSNERVTAASYRFTSLGSAVKERTVRMPESASSATSLEAARASCTSRESLRTRRP